MKNKILILMIIAGFLVSCDDTLDSRLSTSIPVENFVVDLETLESATNGAYSFLQSSNSYGRTAVLLPDLMSDNAYLDQVNGTNRYVAYDAYTLQSNSQFLAGTFSNLADVIVNASIIIRDAEELEYLPAEQDAANQAIGEVKFIRALGYLTMQNLYAQPYNFTSDASHLGVPIPDYELLGGREIISPARATTAEVYQEIINDLTDAIELMGDSPDAGRADQWAAEALLARVYLNMERWSDAEFHATNVINGSGRALVPNGSYINSWFSEFTSESIFSIVNNNVDNAGFDSIGYFYLGYDDAFPTPDFLSLLGSNDVRNGLYQQNPTLGEFQVLKYPDQTTQSDNVPVIRLSEMYLIKAEAHAMQPGEETDAQMALDEIRLRAEPGATPTADIGQNLLDKIIEERRKELAFEGFRLHDLTRLGRDFTKYRQGLPSIDIMAPSEQTVLPIPLVELDRNANMVQNPGY